MCEGSQVRAVIDYQSVPKLAEVETYLELDCSPGGAQRNFESYGHKLGTMNSVQQQILCDPQTSGGLLVAVKQGDKDDFLAVAQAHNLKLDVIGRLEAITDDQPLISIT